MTEVPFRTAFRGYEPTEVDQTLAQLRKALADSNAEVGRLTVDLQHAQAQSADQHGVHQQSLARVAELEQQLTTVGRPSYAEFGETIGRILTLAEEEAARIRAQATAEAEAMLAEARAQADTVTRKADREAAELASASQATAVKTVEDAKRKADEILDHADRESTARREEAEAVYEGQRRKATAAAVDFEKTLAGRRSEAAAEFEAQVQAHQQALADATARRDAAEAEAARLLDQATRQASDHLDNARREAAQHVTEARAQAERVRADSARELAAATQRRDAITAQLSNVRQMLSTLGHGAPFALDAALEAPADGAASPADALTPDAELGLTVDEGPRSR